jgi:predicted pyridoxine 5'-phosphate oxidase superfamily flavin-nucleotide-binding protein
VDIRAVFEKQRVIPIATADRTDHPNVILVGMWFWADEETLCVSENYLNKAKKTSRRNPRSPSTAGRTGRTTMSRGGHFETSGPHHEEVRRRATSGQRQFPGKTTVM